MCIYNSLYEQDHQVEPTDVDESVRYSEQSMTKCIGITIETRPDYCLKPYLSQILRYGCCERYK